MGKEKRWEEKRRWRGEIVILCVNRIWAGERVLLVVSRSVKGERYGRMDGLVLYWFLY